MCRDAVEFDRSRLSVLRTMIEVNGNTSMKPFPKSSAGRRTISLPPWVVVLLREHLDTYPLGAAGLIFANEVGGELRRGLFRSRVWRPSLVCAGMLGVGHGRWGQVRRGLDGGGRATAP